MKIDTNTPYKVPEQYKPKHPNTEPKMKKSAIFMIWLGWFLNVVVAVLIIIGIIFGVSKIIESVQNVSEPETGLEENRA